MLVCKIPFLFGPIKPGDVIVFRHQTYGTMIKTVQRVLPENDEFYVMGTHDHSVDSRRFGPVNKAHVAGKVIWHIKKPGAR